MRAVTAAVILTDSTRLEHVPFMYIIWFAGYDNMYDARIVQKTRNVTDQMFVIHDVNGECQTPQASFHYRSMPSGFSFTASVYLI